MNKVFIVALILLLNLCIICCQERNRYLEALRIKPWKSIQRYVEVRPGAFLFYWLYYADGTITDAYKKPLIIWIQGGPGLAASGIANFAEIGPLTMDMKLRNHTWVHGRNLLLIDHPVGTGFSYAVNSTLYIKTDKDAAKDLLKLICVFFKRHKRFGSTPTYLIGQSYGSKLCPKLALYLNERIKNNLLKMNLRGIGLGSGWVRPEQSVIFLPRFLYHMGFLDFQSLLKLRILTKKIYQQIGKKDYVSVNKANNRIYEIINDEAGMDINYININQLSPYPDLDRLAITVNKYVKPTLTVVNQSLVWNYISTEEIFKNFELDFFLSSTTYVETLLNHTDIKIAIYNGNLDVATPLAGATNWVHGLKWKRAEEFKHTMRTQIRGKHNGLYKSVGQLSYWTVFGAGHWVPEDNPEAMDEILQYLLN